MSYAKKYKLHNFYLSYSINAWFCVPVHKPQTLLQTQGQFWGRWYRCLATETLHHPLGSSEKSHQRCAYCCSWRSEPGRVWWNAYWPSSPLTEKNENCNSCVLPAWELSDGPVVLCKFETLHQPLLQPLGVAIAYPFSSPLLWTHQEPSDSPLHQRSVEEAAVFSLDT